MYDTPLTLKTYIPGDWNEVAYGDLRPEIQSDKKGKYIIFKVAAITNKITLKKI